MTTKSNSNANGGVKCAVCHNEGARWIVKLEGERIAIHRPCGNRLVQMAPEGQKPRLVPSEELRREWQVQAFWKAKLVKAEEARKKTRARACERATNQGDG